MHTDKDGSWTAAGSHHVTRHRVHDAARWVFAALTHTLFVLRKATRLTAAPLMAAVAVVLGALLHAPVANADMLFGNYNLNIGGRYDFHTWIWTITPCPGECVGVFGIAQPIAKAYNYQADAPLVDGRYSLTVDVPDGLRCGNIYYGATIPTHDVYSWDAVSLVGLLTSSFTTGCDGAPGGTFTYPFNLSRM